MLNIRPVVSTAALLFTVAATLGFMFPALAQDAATGGDQEGPDSEVRRYKDWAVECRQPEAADTKRCVMFQRQVLDNGRTLLVMTVRRLPNADEPVAILQLPLGVLLEPGVTVAVDDGEPTTLRYRLCNNGGCIATFELRDELKTALMKGQTAKIVLVTGDQKQLTVDVSLSGFTAALNTL